MMAENVLFRLVLALTLRPAAPSDFASGSSRVSLGYRIFLKYSSSRSLSFYSSCTSI
jgi:hypothetical protein